MTERTPWLSVALVSAAALGYEVLLMRLLSIQQWHHFAYMVISLALLGFGASGTFVTLAQRRLLAQFVPSYLSAIAAFTLTAPLLFALARLIPFNAEAVLWDWHQPFWLAALYLLLAVPFFFAATAIALALGRCRDRVGLVYGADLFGAGLGAIGVIAALYLVFPQDALRLIALTGLAACLVAVIELRRLRLLSLPALLIPVVLVPAAWLEPGVSPYKGLSQLLEVMGARVLTERSSPLGLLSVVESPRIPLRHAPGLALTATALPPEQLAVFTDGDSMTAINRFDGDRGTLDWLLQMTSALPYALQVPDQVLVLGAGGGGALLQALAAGAHRVDAVELNPQMVELVAQDFAGFAGDLYRRPEVSMHVGEARGFLLQHDRRWDLIQLPLTGSAGAVGGGLLALNENYLLTTEAVRLYLERLAAGGMLAMTRWVRLPPRDNLKLFAMAIDALRTLGIEAPGRHLAMIRSWQTATLLVKRSALTGSEIASLRAFCRHHGFDPVWYPGMAAGEANRINQLVEPYFHQAAVALLGPQRAAFMDSYQFDLQPATDEQPYFGHFFRWRSLPQILALRKAGGMPLLEMGYLVLVATLVQAIVLAAALIVLPLRRLRALASMPRGTSRYFVAIGLGFLLLEVTFIHRFILYLHHPVHAAATMLAGFLVFAGLGSLWSRRRSRRRQGWLYVAVAIIVAGSLAAVAGLDSLFAHTAGWPLPTRVVLSLALVAPLAFAMGLPFPLALAELGERAPAAIPWAWCVNGSASVVAAVAASLLALSWGFDAVMLTAAGLYLLAAFSFPTSHPGR